MDKMDKADKSWIKLCLICHGTALVLFVVIGMLAIHVDDRYALLTPLVMIPMCIPFAGSHKIGD